MPFCICTDALLVFFVTETLAFRYLSRSIICFSNVQERAYNAGFTIMKLRYLYEKGIFLAARIGYVRIFFSYYYIVRLHCSLPLLKPTLD